MGVMKRLNQVFVYICIILFTAAVLPGCGGGSLGTGHRPRTVVFQGRLTQADGAALDEAIAVTARSSVATATSTTNPTTGDFEHELVVAEDDDVSYEFRSIDGSTSEKIDSTVSIGVLPSDATVVAMAFAVQEDQQVTLVEINSNGENTDTENAASSADKNAINSDIDLSEDKDDKVAPKCTGADCGDPCVDSAGLGNLCQPAPCADQDLDGLCDEVDLCLTTPSTNNRDADGDGIGDICDNCQDVDRNGFCDDNEPCADRDDDSICDAADLCPNTSSVNNQDVDADGIGDICDSCQDINGDGYCDGQEPCADGDNDGICDEADLCPITVSLNNNDTDADGIGDVCDTCQDVDQNGFCDDNEPCADGDADGFCDAVDFCPANASINNIDSDGDGVGDACDNCINHSNSDQTDTNGDGYGNRCDADFDGSGLVAFADFGAFGAAASFVCGDVNYDQEFDLNSDCSVDMGDFNILETLFGLPPGPSAFAN